MKYADWLRSIPKQITEDPLWNMQVYRKALFLGDVAWRDATKITSAGRWRQLSDQLYRAVGSVSANISEGYSHLNTGDEMRFYRYALGSAREARDWYFKSRHILGEAVVNHRLDVLTDVIRQLLVVITVKKKGRVQEESQAYGISSEELDLFERDAPFAD